MALPGNESLSGDRPSSDRLSSDWPRPAIIAPLPQTALSTPASLLPKSALARLSHLHRETQTAARLAVFQARAVPAAGLLLTMGVVVALAGGGALAPTFAWSLLVQLGIGAILHNHLRGAAKPFAQDLARSAADLRAIFFYLGFAWGAGAFLALAPAPPVLAAFAVLPCAALALVLRDWAGAAAFIAPVTILTSTAVMLRTGSSAGAIAILLFQGALTALLLHRRVRGETIPPGLAKR